MVSALLLSLVALADIFVKDEKSYSGPYLYLYAYIEGWLEQDSYGCLTGWIYGIKGYGGGSIYSPASGKIDVKNPPSVAYGEAKTEVYGEAYINGKLVDKGSAIASISSIPGAC